MSDLNVSLSVMSNTDSGEKSSCVYFLKSVNGIYIKRNQLVAVPQINFRSVHFKLFLKVLDIFKVQTSKSDKEYL